ncbi:MAG: hypothetical protein HY698_06825 [Deltaproteobacteria bacterium]|nr:hypothetical protein [Deltaproteobacteria bacterium]
MRRTGFLGVAVLTLGCTDANLYGTNTQPNLANKISLQGELCTDDPGTVDFPVKVLVVMDGSAELVAADPAGTRATAVANLVARHAGPGYHFGIIQYASQARSPTTGLAGDAASVQAGIDVLRAGTADARRNFLAGLRAASTAIQDDILGATPGERSRTRYVVLWVAYGAPAPSLAESWCDGEGLAPNSDECRRQLAAVFCPDEDPAPSDCEAALYPRMVRELRELAREAGVQDLVFHGFSLGNQERLGVLLQEMATAGRGSTLVQQDGLNLLALDYSVPGFLLVRREFMAWNERAILRQGKLLPDSDGDGLSDDEEAELGTDPKSVDSDGDSVGDGVEHGLAAPGLEFNPLVPSTPAQCSLIDLPGDDRDLDGLTDCEEAVLRTDPTLVDSDGDALPDLVEVRRGGNALIDDTLSDSDLDGVRNGDELRGGLALWENDAQSELEYSYRYRFFDEGARTRLEATPKEPIPGVAITSVSGSSSTVALLRYSPGTPPRLSFSDNAQAAAPGPEVSIAEHGTYTLSAASGRSIVVEVDPAALPPPSEGAKDRRILVKLARRSCFRFDVRNISLVETAEVPGGPPERGWNRVRVFFAEVPEGSPSGRAIFNVTTVAVRFVEPDQKTPNVPFVTLEQDDFVLLKGGF